MAEPFDVEEWLKGLKLEGLTDVFKENALIEREDVVDLSSSDVKEMVPQIGLRNRLLKGLMALKGRGVLRRDSRSPVRGGSRTPRKRSTTPSIRSVSYVPPMAAPLDNALNVKYVTDRKRLEAERKAHREQRKRQEHERWIELLKRTVRHPNFPADDATIKRRQEIEQREAASRRSLSASMHRYHSAKKDKAATPRKRSTNTSSTFTPSVWQRSASPTSSKRPPLVGGGNGELYKDLATAYSSLMPPAQPQQRSIESASPNRRRVWSRNNSRLVTHPPLVPLEELRSPSPPPPPGSPSPPREAGAVYAPPAPNGHGIAEPTMIGGSPDRDRESTPGTPDMRPESPQLTGDESPEEQRERLLALIETNKQQRIRYWLPDARVEAQRS